MKYRVINTDLFINGTLYKENSIIELSENDAKTFPDSILQQVVEDQERISADSSKNVENQKRGLASQSEKAKKIKKRIKSNS